VFVAGLKGADQGGRGSSDPDTGSDARCRRRPPPPPQLQWVSRARTSDHRCRDHVCSGVAGIARRDPLAAVAEARCSGGGVGSSSSCSSGKRTKRSGDVRQGAALVAASPARRGPCAAPVQQTAQEHGAVRRDGVPAAQHVAVRALGADCSAGVCSSARSSEFGAGPTLIACGIKLRGSVLDSRAAPPNSSPPPRPE